MVAAVWARNGARGGCKAAILTVMAHGANSAVLFIKISFTPYAARRSADFWLIRHIFAGKNITYLLESFLLAFATR